MGEWGALVDGHGVGDAVAAVQHHAGRAPGRVERADGLRHDVDRRDVEGLEHDLHHLLAVGLRVERGLRLLTHKHILVPYGYVHIYI